VQAVEGTSAEGLIVGIGSILSSAVLGIGFLPQIWLM
jgi:hypothetical protein